MGDSSDEEIITRKQKASSHLRKQNLENLFAKKEESSEESTDYESESLPEYINTASNATLREIFGTGKEYAYLLDPSPSKVDVVAPERKEPSVAKDFTLDASEVVLFVVENIRVKAKYDEIESLVALLLEGACVQFIVMHTTAASLQIHDVYKIHDLVEYYKGNMRVVEECRSMGTFNLGTISYLKSLRKLRCPFDQKSVFDPVLFLTPEQLRDNFEAHERVHAPVDTDTTPESLCESLGIHEAEMVRFLSRQIGCSSFFKEEVVKWAFANGEVSYVEKTQNTQSYANGVPQKETNRMRLGIDEYTHKIQGNTTDYEVFVPHDRLLSHVMEFYTNGHGSPWNELRARVMRDALNSFNYTHAVRGRIEDLHKENLKISLFNNLVDRIVNGRAEVQGHKAFFMGMAMENRHVTSSVVNYLGDLVEQKIVNATEMGTLTEQMRKYNIRDVYTTGTHPTQAKLFFKIFKTTFPGINLFYVESRVLKKYPTSKDFTQNIVRMVISPETEYAHLLQNNVVLDLIPATTGLTHKEKNVVLERALTTSLSVVGVDVNVLSSHERSRVLLKYIPGLENSAQIINHGFFERLHTIRDRELLSERDFRNAATFLRVFPHFHVQSANFDILDALPVHFNNYQYARMCCAAVLGHEEIEDENTSKVVEEILKCKEKLLEFDLKPFEQNTELYSIIEFCVNVLAENKKYFDGLPDELIFDDLIGSPDMSILYEGRVVKRSPAFYIVDVGNEFAVFVKRTGELHLNQFVRVSLLKKNFETLSFEGCIAGEIRQRSATKERFVKHPLFRNLNFAEAEGELRQGTEDFLLRKASREGYFVLVIKFTDEIFVHVRVEEGVDHYVCSNRHFEDVDEIISAYVMPTLRNLRTIKSHKNYFSSAEEAEIYLSNFDRSKVIYSFYFSTKYAGKLVFAFNDGRITEEYISVSDVLVYDKREFESLDGFLAYRKSQK